METTLKNITPTQQQIGWRIRVLAALDKIVQYTFQGQVPRASHSTFCLTAATSMQARMTLVGDMAEVEKTEELKQAFLALHNEAFYVDFDDFLCMRMEVKALRWVFHDHQYTTSPDESTTASAGCTMRYS